MENSTICQSFNLSKVMTKNNAGLSEDYTKQFQQMIRNWGASLVGIGDVSEGLAREFRHLPRAVALAVAHPPIEEGVYRAEDIIAYSNQFPAVDEKLENLLHRVTSYLRSMGWRAFTIPPDTDKPDERFSARLYPLFSHKTAATCAGLGWVGKNGLLITKKYGARLSWGTVLTNAPLDVAKKPFLKGQCNHCQKCVEACPVGAIKGKEWTRQTCQEPVVNFIKCAHQLSINEKVLGNFICGKCIIACPWGKRENNNQVLTFNKNEN